MKVCILALLMLFGTVAANAADYGSLVRLTRELEGLSLTVYPDPATGDATIGYGHNLIANPLRGIEWKDITDAIRTKGKISLGQAERLMRHDLDSAAACVSRATRLRLDAIRYTMIIMAYNMGCSGWLKWGKTIAAARAGDRATIARNIKHSKLPPARKKALARFVSAEVDRRG